MPNRNRENASSHPELNSVLRNEVGTDPVPTDVAERVPSAQALKDSEARYQRLFETAQDGILILNAKTGAITDVNPFLITLLNYSREKLLCKPIFTDREQ